MVEGGNLEEEGLVQHRGLPSAEGGAWEERRGRPLVPSSGVHRALLGHWGQSGALFLVVEGEHQAEHQVEDQVLGRHVVASRQGCHVEDLVFLNGMSFCSYPLPRSIASLEPGIVHLRVESQGWLSSVP